MEWKQIDYIIVLGTAAMLLLSTGIIVFMISYQRRLYQKKQEMAELELNAQKELMDAVILTKEKEQKRIAQELHDGIGSALTALKVGLIQTELSPEEKQWIGDSIKAIGNDVRRISNELMPSILEDMGLKIAMGKLTENIEIASNIKITVINTNEEGFSLEPQEELAIYRVIQEILNNIVKYANATSVVIRETHTTGKYLLEISDDGDGFSPTQSDLSKVGSLGLKNIKSRVQQIKGTIDYQKLEPKGTKVIIEKIKNE